MSGHEIELRERGRCEMTNPTPCRVGGDAIAAWNAREKELRDALQPFAALIDRWHDKDEAVALVERGGYSGELHAISLADVLAAVKANREESMSTPIPRTPSEYLINRFIELHSIYDIGFPDRDTAEAVLRALLVAIAKER